MSYAYGINLFLMIFPHMSLNYKLGSVHYQEYESVVVANSNSSALCSQWAYESNLARKARPHIAGNGCRVGEHNIHNNFIVTIIYIVG